MKNSLLASGVLSLAVLFGLARPATAQYEPNQPKILLHVAALTTKGQCTSNFTASLPNCAAAVTSAVSSLDGSKTYFVYVVVAKGDSMPDVAGVQLGITYDNSAAGMGIDMYAWTLCQGVPGPPCAGSCFPSAGSGTIITWGSCPTDPVINVGYFYLAAYTASTLWIIPRPVDGVAEVVDCSAHLSGPLPTRALGFVSFSPDGTLPGCNPCLEPCVNSIPATPTTWGGVKSLYQEN